MGGQRASRATAGLVDGGRRKARGRWAGKSAGLATAFVTVSGVMVVAGPVVAADTVECGPTASVFAAEAGGQLKRYPLNSPGSAAPSWGGDTVVGGGWNSYGRVLGGPGGRLYGINSTGMYRYRYTGSGWETIDGSQKLDMGTSLAAYASNAARNKITVDERGDFYAVDSTGRLRWYRYDEDRRAWVISGRVLATGWDRFDLIVAAGPGVLYARTPAGLMYRHRFEPVSQRWIVRDKQVDGPGWQNFSRGMFSLGGDTLFGIQADGDLYRYRYREDNDSFPVGGIKSGGKWQQFPNVAATTDTCRLTASYTPVRPHTPVQAFTRPNVLQPPPSGSQAFGPVSFLYPDNLGRLHHGFAPDPDDFRTTQWTTITADEAFTGQPALVTNGQGLVQAVAHNIDSDAVSRTMVDHNSPSWQDWVNLSGAMKSAPVAVRLADRTLAVFALDADGKLWVRPQDGPGGDFLPWRQLGDLAMTGEPTAVSASDGTVTLFAVDVNGAPHFAVYRSGSLSGWASMGGSGFTGSPTPVLLPGRQVRVFARAADGKVMTQRQDSSGGFPGTWVALGDFVVTGQPAAILDPALGRIAVVARGPGNEVYNTYETAQGTGEWGSWEPINPRSSDPSATDPVVTPAGSTNTGESWLIVFRNENDVTKVYWRTSVSVTASVPSPFGKAAPAPAFGGQSLPGPDSEPSRSSLR